MGVYGPSAEADPMKSPYFKSGTEAAYEVTSQPRSLRHFTSCEAGLDYAKGPDAPIRLSLAPPQTEEDDRAFLAGCDWLVKELLKRP